MNTREHGCLQATRRHILGAAEGMDEDALRRPVLPSGWSVLAMLQHLTNDIERFWFRAVIAAEPDVVASYEAAPSDAWTVAEDAVGADVIAAYRAETERADAIIAATSADAPPRWWPGDLFGDWRLDDLHDVVMHVIVENACHAGHLDAVRELVDGRQWLVLT